MRLALAEARAAPGHADVPIGAVVLAGGDVIALRHNERELTGDPTAHAEVLALRDASARLGQWRLSECTVVVTLEPSRCAPVPSSRPASGALCSVRQTRKPAPAAPSTTCAPIRG